MAKFLAVALFIIAAFFSIADRAGAAAPDNADPSLGPWYQGLKQPGSGISCCSIADCRQVDYRVEGDHYEALIQDKWLRVPPEKVLEHELNPTGHAVVCYTPWQGILCFVSASEA